MAGNTSTEMKSRDLPTGVVTLLFTDVEGSTNLLHELGDEYGAALHEHRRIVRNAFGAHDGVEVDTQGDAFFVAFARASDAVAAAADAQRALDHGPIRVRMGLHSGEPQLTDEGYVGLDVHKGARIAAAGHGGQVLLSEAAHALVDAPARDLGRHRLKDITAPERIYQLEIEGLPSEFPLLKTLDAGVSNLPSPRTSFVGRRSELEEIEHRLADPDCRLLTLVGPGGVGKTRLALEAAARRLDRYAHGVHFVPLASVAAPDFLAPAVADAIEFPIDAAHSGFSAQDQLVDYLSERSTLLVLDNFEHLVEGADLVARVIERAPDVEILTTSRERLNVQSEWVLDVGGSRRLCERQRWQAPTGPSGCSSNALARSMPASSSVTRSASTCCVSAGSWTACRSGSSWRPRGCPRFRARRSPTRSRPRSASWRRRCETFPNAIAAFALPSITRGAC